MPPRVCSPLAAPARKNRALAAMAAAIRASRAAILAANAEDVAEAKSAGVAAAFLDRLTLDAKRVEAMAAGIDVVRKLKDPVGTVLTSWRRPNGMRIERVRVPLGVVGVIYESRPERDRRRRRAVPESRQRRDPARRLRQLPLDAALSMPHWSKGWREPACRPPPSRSCRRASAPPWA